MGLTKSEIFTGEQNKLAAMLKAMAHPARIAILQELLKTNTCICGGLVDELGLAQPTYVLDIPGGAGKVPIGPDMVEPGGVRDPAGRLHAYPHD